MTDFRASVGRRYHVGLTSVLRRCVAVGVVISGLQLPAPAQAGQGYSGEDMFRAALEHCVPRVENYRKRVDDWVQSDDPALERDVWDVQGLRVLDIGSNTAFQGSVSVWVPEGEHWYLLQSDYAPFTDCSVFAFDFDHAALVDHWNEFITSGAHGFRHNRLAEIRDLDVGHGGCGSSLRAKGDDFVKMSFCAFDYDADYDGYAPLPSYHSFVFVQNTVIHPSDLCEFLPEECG